MKEYSEWVAGLRHRPTIFDAEAILKKDYPLKLPDRRYLHMWNSPEISEFRGVQTNINAFEEKQARVEAEQAQIKQIGREQGLNTVDITQVADILSRQERSMTAMQQSMADLGAVHMQQEAGRRQEMQSMFERLAVGQAGAENRARVVEEANQRNVDMLMADRDRVHTTAASAGSVVNNNVDNTQIDSSTHVHQTFVDQNVHNQMLSLVQHNSHQFGAYMQQNNMNQEQMMTLLHRFATQRPEAIIHYLPSPEASTMMQIDSAPPPAPEHAPLAIRQNRGVIRTAAPADPPTNPQQPGLPPDPPPPPGGWAGVLPGPSRAIRTPAPERFDPISGTRGRSLAVKAAPAVSVPVVAPAPVVAQAPVAPTPAPAPVPTIGDAQHFRMQTPPRATTTDVPKRAAPAKPKPRAKSRVPDDVEQVPVAAKPRGRSARRKADEEDPRIDPKQIPPRSRSRQKPAPEEPDSVPVPRPRSSSRKAQPTKSDETPFPKSRSASRKPLGADADMPDRVPAPKPRGRSNSAIPLHDYEATPVPRGRSTSRKVPPAPSDETPFPKSRSASRKPLEADAEMSDVIPQHVPKKKPISVRLKLHQPRGKRRVAAAVAADPAPESATISKIAQVLAPDVLTIPKATPARAPKMAKIPEAPPQGNRQMKVQKVNLKGVIKDYGSLKNKPLIAKLMQNLDAGFQEIDKQAQRKRRVKNVQIMHDLRDPIAVA